MWKCFNCESINDKTDTCVVCGQKRPEVKPVTPAYTTAPPASTAPAYATTPPSSAAPVYATTPPSSAAPVYATTPPPAAAPVYATTPPPAMVQTKSNKASIAIGVLSGIIVVLLGVIGILLAS